MNSYRILLADNHELFRHGIRNIVCQAKDIHIVAETNNGHELFELIEESHPDMIIMEIDLPKMNGLEVLRKVKKEYPEIKLLILTTIKEREIIFKAINSGVDGFILKEDPSSELTRAIENIRDGKKFFSALLSYELMNVIRPEIDILSVREKEVLQCLSEGTPNHKIADSLNISIYTLYRHRHNIRRKLHCRNQTDMIKYALSHKMIGYP